VTDALTDVVRRTWGYTSLMAHQRESMEAVMAGRDSVVVLPTGGGKSLCFQAPALLQDGLAVVVSPLISLMKDQVDSLRSNGVPAACYHSGMDGTDRQSVLDAVSAGRCPILYVSPERLAGPGFRAFLSRCQPRFFAIDEAHCISHWGHDFRPEYRQLGELREVFEGVSVHAFTATATERVRGDIAEQLRLDRPQLIIGSFDRPNLVYRVLRKDGVRAQIRRVLDRHAGDAGIIYCISRREVEALAEHLHELGHRVLPYHAGLDDGVRRRNQDAFAHEQVDIIVATVAFGMGIDRSNVRFVIHAGSPKALEHYQQEAGRAGRDGLAAECVLLWSGADLAAWERILEGSGELTDASRAHLRDMARYASQVRCRHRALVEYFGQAYGGDGCGACDVCLGELEAIDEPVILAQKILSCVVRMRQRWGVGQVMDVLRGRRNDRVEGAGHDQLSTFGLLEPMPVAELRGHIEQLVDGGFLGRTTGDYPVLQVTEAGWQVLRDQEGLELYRQRRPARSRKRSRATMPPGVEVLSEADQDLFEVLRALRKEIAEERNVPPYVVFHDRSLHDMAVVKPTDARTFRLVHGVGDKKAADLGDRFLDVITAYCEAAGSDQDGSG
jgi:ATP-dependent DNA helicase RecQ